MPMQTESGQQNTKCEMMYACTCIYFKFFGDDILRSPEIYTRY